MQRIDIDIDPTFSRDTVVRLVLDPSTRLVTTSEVHGCGLPVEIHEGRVLSLSRLCNSVCGRSLAEWLGAHVDLLEAVATHPECAERLGDFTTALGAAINDSSIARYEDAEGFLGCDSVALVAEMAQVGDLDAYVEYCLAEGKLRGSILDADELRETMRYHLAEVAEMRQERIDALERDCTFFPSLRNEPGVSYAYDSEEGIVRRSSGTYEVCSWDDWYEWADWYVRHGGLSEVDPVDLHEGTPDVPDDLWQPV